MKFKHILCTALVSISLNSFAGIDMERPEEEILFLLGVQSKRIAGRPLSRVDKRILRFIKSQHGRSVEPKIGIRGRGRRNTLVKPDSLGAVTLRSAFKSTR